MFIKCRLFSRKDWNWFPLFYKTIFLKKNWNFFCKNFFFDAENRYYTVEGDYINIISMKKALDFNSDLYLAFEQHGDTLKHGNKEKLFNNL